MFSAPASFLALPIEGVFRQIKLVDFRERQLPDSFKVNGNANAALTKKQTLLAQIAHYILTMDTHLVNAIYQERLLKLEHFLQRRKV